MSVRVTTFQIPPDQLSKALQVAEEVAVPAMRQQDGFRGHIDLVDRANGKAVSLTFWDNEADITAGESSGYYREQVARFASYVTAQPTREIYEVSTIDLQQ